MLSSIPPPPLVTSALGLGLDAFVTVRASIVAGVADSRAAFELTLAAPVARLGVPRSGGARAARRRLERLRARVDDLDWLESVGAIDLATRRRVAESRFACDVDARPEGSRRLSGRGRSSPSRDRTGRPSSSAGSIAVRDRRRDASSPRGSRACRSRRAAPTSSRAARRPRTASGARLSSRAPRTSAGLGPRRSALAGRRYRIPGDAPCSPPASISPPADQALAHRRVARVGAQRERACASIPHAPEPPSARRRRGAGPRAEDALRVGPGPLLDRAPRRRPRGPCARHSRAPSPPRVSPPSAPRVRRRRRAPRPRAPRRRRPCPRVLGARRGHARTSGARSPATTLVAIEREAVVAAAPPRRRRRFVERPGAQAPRRATSTPTVAPSPTCCTATRRALPPRAGRSLRRSRHRASARLRAATERRPSHERHARRQARVSPPEAPHGLRARALGALVRSTKASAASSSPARYPVGISPPLAALKAELLAQATGE